MSALWLVTNRGKRIFQISGGSREANFLFKRISELVQHFNTILLPVHDTLQAVYGLMVIPAFIFSRNF